MTHDRRRDILEERTFPTVNELEDGLPFRGNSIRKDMIAFAESEMRRHDELAAQDATWNGSEYRAALEAWIEAATDEATTNETLIQSVHRVTAGMASGSASKARCLVYVRALTASEDGSQPSGTPDNGLIARLSDIYTGKAFPDAFELLRGMPWYKDSLRWDMRTFAGMILRAERGQGRTEGRLVDRATRLKEAANDGSVSDRDLMTVVRLLSSVLPADERQGRLRCRIYLAALGDRMCQILLACDAVSSLVVHAKAGDAIEQDYELAQTAIGWMAVFASADSFPLLGADIKPGRMKAHEDTAMWHGRTVVHMLRGLPMRKGKPDRDGIADRFIEKDGDFLPEMKVMDLLGIGFEDMDELVADRRVIVVPWRGNRYYPAFQFRDGEILPGLAAVLGSLSITDPWETLDWFLAAHPGISGTPLEALLDGRRDEVLQAIGRGPDGHAARYGIARKEWLLKKIGGAVEEELAANWLGISAGHLHQAVREGTFIGVEMDGRMVYPAFQMKDSMTVLTVREALAALPLRDPWRLLEWWLTHHLGLFGQTPLEHLMAGRRDKVLDAAKHAPLDE